MRHTQRARELWEELDIVDRDLQTLIDQRQQIDEWIREAIEERTETLRQLSTEGVEPEYA
jgi:hypothetical protein